MARKATRKKKVISAATKRAAQKHLRDWLNHSKKSDQHYNKFHGYKKAGKTLTSARDKRTSARTAREKRAMANAWAGFRKERKRAGVAFNKLRAIDRKAK